jgi:hypothetical protein
MGWSGGHSSFLLECLLFLHKHSQAHNSSQIPLDSVSHLQEKAALEVLEHHPLNWNTELKTSV